ncbi:MAG TPA: hypothetical protein VGT82_00905 [Ktedonobacteraceae bacterium]|nr:hypothetical protein [Ktedonobacteraceae bacterium]
MTGSLLVNSSSGCFSLGLVAVGKPLANRKRTVGPRFPFCFL